MLDGVCEELGRGADDVGDVARRIDDCVPAPALERGEVAFAISAQLLGLGEELGVRLAPVEEGHLVAAGERVLDRRAPEELRPAEDEQLHSGTVSPALWIFDWRQVDRVGSDRAVETAERGRGVCPLLRRRRRECARYEGHPANTSLRERGLRGVSPGGFRAATRRARAGRACSQRSRACSCLKPARCRTSSRPASTSSSAGSTRVACPQRPEPTSPIPATTSGASCTRRASRRGCSTRRSRHELLGLGIGVTNAAYRTTPGSGDLRRSDFAGSAERLERVATELEAARDRLRRQGGLPRRVRRAARARAAVAQAGRDRALRPAVDIPRECRGAVLRTPQMVPRPRQDPPLETLRRGRGLCPCPFTTASRR